MYSTCIHFSSFKSDRYYSNQLSLKHIWLSQISKRLSLTRRKGRRLASPIRHCSIRMSSILFRLVYPNRRVLSNHRTDPPGSAYCGERRRICYILIANPWLLEYKQSIWNLFLQLYSDSFLVAAVYSAKLFHGPAYHLPPFFLYVGHIYCYFTHEDRPVVCSTALGWLF